MGLIRRPSWDNRAVAPIIWAIVLIGGAVVGMAGYKLLVERPDVVYNIEDAGISFAGIDIGSDMILLISAGAIILIVLFTRGRAKK